MYIYIYKYKYINIYIYSNPKEYFGMYQTNLAEPYGN